MDKWRQELAENIDKYILGPDEKFQFKCLGCGKCCKDREDIMLTTRDLYNIAKKLGMTMEGAIETYCDTYIGRDSRIPIVRLQPRGQANACPLLKDKRCSVHDAKPAVCALFPLGRVMMKKTEDSAISAGYILQPISCGSRTRTHTVKSWLEKFGIPMEDEFYVLWNETILFLSEYFCGLEEKKVPDFVLEMLWNMTFGALYAAYDTGVDLIPQFRENTSKLKQILSDLDAESVYRKLLTKLPGGVDDGK